MPRNSLPSLINCIRPTLGTIAEWADVSVGLARMWQQGTLQLQPEDRSRFVKAIRQHA